MMTVSGEPQLGDNRFAAVHHRSRVSGLMGIDSDREHHDLLTSTA
jgi:hypothetical protein